MERPGGWARRVTQFRVPEKRRKQDPRLCHHKRDLVATFVQPLSRVGALAQKAMERADGWLVRCTSALVERVALPARWGPVTAQGQHGARIGTECTNSSRAPASSAEVDAVAGDVSPVLPRAPAPVGFSRRPNGSAFTPDM